MEPLVLLLPRLCKPTAALTNHSKSDSMCQLGSCDDPNDSTSMADFPSEHCLNSDLKSFVDLATAALHLRQRMKEENLIHTTHSAYFNDENNNNQSHSLFHNCFHSHETLHWLIDKQLCKTFDDGAEIFRVLAKLKIIHHVCDLNEFEYSATSNASVHHNVKYLYRFRLDDGTADENPSFERFNSLYETYTSLFTLERNQCRGVDLQAKSSSINPYDEQIGIALKGDNLARMLAFRSCANMSNVERLADELMLYGLIRFDICDQPAECHCSQQRFRNDEHHQYLLSLSHRLLPKQRLDLIALMQNDLKETSFTLVDSFEHREKLRTSSSNSSIGTRRTHSNSEEIQCPLKISCSVDGLRRKKSASLNSPANSVDNRPTAEELERRELPWCWRSYSLKRDRRGYGLILQGQGPCYVERIDPYGSAYSSGIRVNEYIFAIEGINVLRRSGKEVERLLSMFDKCTIYTIYNRLEFSSASPMSVDLNEKKEFSAWKPYSSSLTEYPAEHKSLLTTVNYSSLNAVNPSTQSYSSSPSSSIDGSSSCSISPKHSQNFSTSKRGPLTKHLPFLRFSARSCSNTLK